MYPAHPGAPGGMGYGDQAVKLTVFARNLDAKDMGGLGKSDPFLVVSATTAGGKKTTLIKTEVTLSPLLSMFCFSMFSLGGSNV